MICIHNPTSKRRQGQKPTRTCTLNSIAAKKKGEGGVWWSEGRGEEGGQGMCAGWSGYTGGQAGGGI